MAIDFVDTPYKKSASESGVHDLLVKASIYHKKGKWDKAQQFYLKVLKRQPHHPDALHLLGLIFQQKGDLQKSIKYLRKAIEHNAGNALYYLNLGGVLQQQGKLVEAAQSYRLCISVNDEGFEPYYNLALLCERMDELDQAESNYLQAIRRNPGYVDAYNNLGNLYQRREEFDKAVDQYNIAIRLQPNFHSAYNNLGHAYLVRNNWEVAQQNFQRALSIDSTNAQYKVNMAVVLTKQGKTAAATQLLIELLDAGVQDAQVHNNLGSLYLQQGVLAMAKQHLQIALQLKPQYCPAITNLANVYLQEGYSSKAMDILDHEESSCQISAEFYDAVANAYRIQGEIVDAIDAFQKALSLQSNAWGIYSNYLLTTNYAQHLSADEIFAEHMKWGESMQCAISENTPIASTPRSSDKIRLGFLSPDFREHSVSYFLQALFTCYDRERFEFIAYVDHHAEDVVTEKFQQLAHRWLNVAGLSDTALVDSIGSDKVDILFDLSGHSANNRLGVFARQAAPVQVAYLGYPNTTGLANMHYRLTDAYADPKGAECLHSEKLLRMAQSFLCYTPPSSIPALTPPPLLENGYVTFGSFNNLAKMSSSVVDCWANILLAVPDSRLLLKAKALVDSVVRERVMGQFEQLGVDRQRIQLASYAQDSVTHLQHYASVDIALDPFPYNGTTTTFEALLMGVPVVTLCGDRHAARVGYSILMNLQYTDWVAEHPQAYRDIAVALATDAASLTEIRLTLRGRLLESNLTDGPRFARDFTTAMETLVVQ